MDLVLSFNNSANLLTDARQIIDKTKELAFRSVNVAMLQRNWYLGKRISEEILQGEDRAEYGSQVILQLSKELTDIYGKGFGKNNLYRNVQFFKLFPNIFPTLSGQSKLLSKRLSNKKPYICFSRANDFLTSIKRSKNYKRNNQTRTILQKIHTFDLMKYHD